MARKRSSLPSYSIAMLGPGGVGKTSLLSRYLPNPSLSFSSTSYQPSPPVTAYPESKQAVDSRWECMLRVWDFGSSVFESEILKHVDGFVIVFGLDEAASSLEQALEMRSKLTRLLNQDDPLISLVGNKSDTQVARDLTLEQIQERVSSLPGLVYLETSAKENVNVAEVFDSLLRRVHERQLRKTQEDGEASGCCKIN